MSYSSGTHGARDENLTQLTFPTKKSKLDWIFQTLPSSLNWITALRTHLPADFNTLDPTDSIDLTLEYNNARSGFPGCYNQVIQPMSKEIRAFLYHGDEQLYYADFVKCKLHVVFNIIVNACTFKPSDAFQRIINDPDQVFQNLAGTGKKRFKTHINGVLTSSSYLPKIKRHVTQRQCEFLSQISQDSHAMYQELCCLAKAWQFGACVTPGMSQGRFTSAVFKIFETIQVDDMITNALRSGFKVLARIHDCIYFTSPNKTPDPSMLLDPEFKPTICSEPSRWTFNKWTQKIDIVKVDTSDESKLKARIFDKFKEVLSNEKALLSYEADDYRPVAHPMKAIEEIRNIFLGNQVEFHGVEGKATSERDPDHWKNDFTVDSHPGDLFYMSRDGTEIRIRKNGTEQDTFVGLTSCGRAIFGQEESVYGEIKPTDCDDYIEVDEEWTDVEYILRADSSRQTCLIRGNCGSGKSHSMRSYLPGLISTMEAMTGKRPKVLWFAPRLRLLQSTATQFPKSLRVKCYLENKNTKASEIDLSDIDVFLTTKESLYKVPGFYTGLFDIVVLDESEVFGENLSSSLGHCRHRSNVVFEAYMKNATKVVCLDAYLGKISLHIGHSLRNDTELSYLRNTRIKHPRVY